VPPLHELKGWDELNRWAMINHPQWAAIQRRLVSADGMSEIDKLRLLAGEMLRRNVDLIEREMDELRRSPMRIFIPENAEVSHRDRERQPAADQPSEQP
jgi:hypothetical protein